MQTELNWLLDDAIAGMLTGAGAARQTSWRSIERGLRANGLDQQQLQQVVQLRAPLHVLGALAGLASLEVDGAGGRWDHACYPDTLRCCVCAHAACGWSHL